MHPFRPTLAFLLVFGIAPIASAQTAAKSAEFFKTYCTECHGHSNPKPQTPNPKPQTPNPKPLESLFFIY